MVNRDDKDYCDSVPGVDLVVWANKTKHRVEFHMGGSFSRGVEHTTEVWLTLDQAVELERLIDKAIGKIVARGGAEWLRAVQEETKDD